MHNRRHPKSFSSYGPAQINESSALQTLPLELQTYIIAQSSTVQQLQFSWLNKDYRQFVFEQHGETLRQFQLRVDGERNKNNFVPLTMEKVEACSDKLLACTSNPANNWLVNGLRYVSCATG